MTWSDEDILKLIEMYRELTALWDSTHSDYKNKNKRHDALTEIANSFGTEKYEIEKKIKYLQSHFSRERKKEMESKTTGTGAYEIYESKWFAYKSLLFLADRNKPRKTVDSVKAVHSTNSSPVSFDEIYKQEAASDISIEKIQSTTTAETGQAEEMKYTAKTSKRKAPLEPLSPKIQKNSHGPQVGYTYSATETLEDNLNHAAPIPLDDSYDYFGKYISSMLRSIGPPRAMRLQEQITHLVTQAMCPPE